MTMAARPSFHDIVAGLSPTRGWRAVRHFVYGTPLYGLMLKGRVPDKLRGTPPDPWPGDPAVGAAIVKGQLAIAGTSVSLAGNPWTRKPESGEAAAALHAFAWLADLKTLGSEAAGKRARKLVNGWIKTHSRWSALAWRPDVLGERLSHWFCSHDFLCLDDDPAFQARFLSSAATQARHLQRVCAKVEKDAGAFAAIKGLIYSGICLPGCEKAIDTGLKLLSQEIVRQILPDGGHFQRCPSLHLSVLAHLLDLRGTLIAAKLEVPVSWQRAIDTMAPMLRSFRLGDGGLALFNGGNEEDARHIDAVLGRAGVKGKALLSAPHSGFQRLAAGRTVIIADTGAPPAASFLAHAGTLSFEMSVGKERLIVNCGALGDSDPAWRFATRATAAHSTLTVDGASSSEVRADAHIGRRPADVASNRKEADGNIWLEARHDGYPGLVHHRRLYLDACGEDVRGEDILAGSGGREFTLRFHLHPLIGVSLTEGGSAVLLRLPSGVGWRFLADGGAIGLEESIYAGRPNTLRRCSQIVVSGPLDDSRTTVKWALHREGGRR